MAQVPDPKNVTLSWRVQALFLCVLIVFSGTLHLLYHFGNLYGEHDAARFVVDAVIWAKTGVRSVALSEYRYFVSPAYIYFAKLAYELSRITQTHPEVYLDLITNVATVLLFVPAYFLFSNLIGPLGAFFACFYLQLIPNFWYVGLYGFPTTIALCLVVIALLLWDLFLCDRLIIGKWPHIAMILAIALLAMLMKADVWILSTPALVGLAILRRGLAWRLLFIAALIATAAIVIGYETSHALIQNAPQATAYASAWNRQFGRANATAIGEPAPTLVDALRLYAMSLGIGTIPAVGVAILAMLLDRNRRLAIAIAIWLPASFLFWAWRPGDSSRHHVPAALPAALAVGYLFGHAARYRYLIYPFLAAVVVINYVRYPPSDDPLSASGRLLETAALSRNEAAKIQHAADTYVTSKCDGVLLGSALLPYAEAALLVRANNLTVQLGEENGYPVRQFVYGRDGSSCKSTEVIVLNRASALQAAKLFSAQGRTVYSYEYNFSMKPDRAHSLNKAISAF